MAKRILYAPLSILCDCWFVKYLLQGEEFDSAYGPAWHCIVGTSFGSYVTHSLGGFLYFSIDKIFIRNSIYTPSHGPILKKTLTESEKRGKAIEKLAVEDVTHLQVQAMADV
ncbi:hypothetical protein ACLOJK_007146 [Asimina triloba]